MGKGKHMWAYVVDQQSLHPLSLLCLMSCMRMQRAQVACGLGAPVAANRGASGIDGVMSSAAGFAFGLNRPATLLVGDISFLHDINGLNLLRTGACA